MINLQAERTRLSDCISLYEPTRHPFHIAWSQNQLSIAEVSVYAEQYHAVSANYELLLEKALERIGRHPSRHTVLSLWSELSNPTIRQQKHLWLDLLENLGNKLDGVLSRPTLPAVRNWLNFIDCMMLHGTTIEILSVVYICETYMPRLSDRVLFAVAEEDLVVWVSRNLSLKNESFYAKTLMSHLERETRNDLSANFSANNVLQEAASWTWNLLNEIEKNRLENFYAYSGSD